MRWSALSALCVWATLVAIMAAAAWLAVDAQSTSAARAAEPGGCLSVKLVGDTVHHAQAIARAHYCELRLRGARPVDTRVQTIRRQQHASHTIVVWVNPLCGREGAPGPPAVPAHSPGPTELITGLYVDGGPLVPFSTPGCAYKRVPGDPEGGTITVRDQVTDAIVATETVANDRLATFPLAPGGYTVVGRFTNGNGTLGPMHVDIVAGETTRDYLVLIAP